QTVEVSVVSPCLNEQDTLARCLEKARKAFSEHGIAGEILVADNGSTDLSRTIAEREGARVVTVQEPGYGSALMGGIAAANGRFVVIGDADDSYDFLELPKIVEKLREGFDLVQGCRLQAGGGWIRPGARPLLHRRILSPVCVGCFSSPVEHLSALVCLVIWSPCQVCASGTARSTLIRCCSQASPSCAVINGSSSPSLPKRSPLPRDSFHQTGTWNAFSNS